jgi:hypothetical protein
MKFRDAGLASLLLLGLSGWLSVGCTGGAVGGMVSSGGDSGQEGGASAGNRASGGNSGDGGNTSGGSLGKGGASSGGAGGVRTGGMGGGSGGVSGGTGGVTNGGSPGTGGTGNNNPNAVVPIFLAVGWGGRSVISCDQGRTWVANQQIAPESEDDWHKAYTPKGLAYGNGTFIFLTGWGANAVARITNDGVTWRQFQFNAFYGGIGFDTGKFVVVGGGGNQISSNNGMTWTAENTSATMGMRESAAFDGVWASGGDGPVAIRRGTAAWTQLKSCTNMYQGGIGQAGGFAAGLGLLVSVAEAGNTCALNVASGVDVGAGNLGVGLGGKPAFVGDAFWAVTGDRIHSSTDGKTWQSRALPQNVRFDLVARSNTGTYVGVAGNGDNFFYSDNGTTWTKAIGPSGNGLLRLTFGMGSPSATCPAP